MQINRIKIHRSQNKLQNERFDNSTYNEQQYFDIHSHEFSQFLKDDLINSILKLDASNMSLSLNCKIMAQHLRKCNSLDQFMRVFVGQIVQAKDKDAHNCYYINAMLTKQMDFFKNQVKKYEMAIQNLTKLYQQAKQFFQEENRSLLQRIQYLQEQNLQLQSKIKIVNSNIVSSPQNSAILNLRQSYPITLNIRKPSKKSRKNYQLQQTQSQLQILDKLQKLGYDRNIQSNEVTFCLPESDPVSLSSISKISRVSKMDIKEQIKQLRQNHKRLQQVLLDKERQIARLTKLFDVNEHN